MKKTEAYKVLKKIKKELDKKLKYITEIEIETDDGIDQDDYIVSINFYHKFVYLDACTLYEFSGVEEAEIKEIVTNMFNEFNQEEEC